MSTGRRVGLVGAGWVALREHLPNSRYAGGSVTALCDVIPGRAAELAETHRIPRAYTDYRELVADPEVDIVAICTGPGAHREIALAAVAAGKHVFMEKPPTRTAEEMREVGAAAERAGVCMLAGSMHPYRENVVELRRRIAAGDLGEVYAIDCFKLRRNNPPKDAPQAEGPNGVASGSTVHRIDVSLYLLGCPQAAFVTARFYDHHVRAATEAAGEAFSGLCHDSVIATVHFENGCTLTIRDLLAAHMSEPNFMQCWFGDLTVYGSKAGAHLHPLTLYQNLPDGGQRVEVPAVNNDLRESHGPAYAYLFDCIERGVKPDQSPERAAQVMAIHDAIYASAAQNGRQVVVGSGG